jgi:hypothetical protein
MMTLAFVVLFASPASAANEHLFLEQFGSVAKPSFFRPTAIGVDQSNGQLYVYEPNGFLHSTLYRFNADGTPADFSALGTNEIDSLHTAEALGDAGLAIDDSGTATNRNVYLTERVLHLVEIFSPSGEELGQLSKYETGPSAEGPLTDLGEVCGVAVDSAGAVYVSEYGGQIHKYVPSGNVPIATDNTANFQYENACSLAAGTGPTAGYVFATSWHVPFGGKLSKLDATTGEVKYVMQDHVLAVSVDPATGQVYALNQSAIGTAESFTHYDASGSESATTLATVEVPASKSDEEGTLAKGIAVDGSTGNIYVSAEDGGRINVYSPLAAPPKVEALPADEVSATKATLHGRVNPNGELPTECKFEFGTVEGGGFPNSIPCEEPPPGDEEPHEVSAVLNGLPPTGAEYHFRLFVANSGTSGTSDSQTFDTPLRVFTAPARTITTGGATLAGVVRPEGGALTECYFEYGRSTSYEATVPCSPEAESIPHDFGAYPVSSVLAGLAQGLSYHYRVVIADAGGSFFGQDEVFSTREASGLPDGRVYEQVSPVDKNESDVLAAGGVASVDGDRVHFLSRGAFAGSPTALGADGLPYMATRGPNGWATESIAMPNGRLTLGEAGYQGFTPDLSKGIVKWQDDSAAGPYDPSAPRGLNLYMRNSASSSFQLVSGTLNSLIETDTGLIWGSRDFSNLAIDASTALTPDSPCSGGGDRCVYEWDHGQLRLASILPNGTPTQGTAGQFPFRCNSEHAMSDDGSRLFFTSPPGFSDPSTTKLYVRENGVETHDLSLPERTAPGGASGGAIFYQSAEAAHGDRVLFITTNSLVDADTDSSRDLYLYDFTKPPGERLTLVSEDHDPSGPQGAEVASGGVEHPLCGGFIGASEDLKRIYFAANNQIVAGEPDDPGPKIFLWDDTGEAPHVSYVGAVGSADSLIWSAPSVYARAGSARQARWSADGRFLAFLSTARLTVFDNAHREEIYVYDAVTGSLQCASCRSDAFPAEGEIAFNGTFYGTFPLNHLVKNVSDKGQVFFQTSRGLVPRDSNGKSDVYEYENGRLHLISKGTGKSSSYFLDASPSGDDTFFVTADRLVGWDTDQNVDVYDARAGGGFPEPPPAPPACEGDACQPPPSVPNDQTPSSASFSGAASHGTPKHSRRCAKGKVKKQGKCLKRKSKAKRHNRHSTRANG